MVELVIVAIKRKRRITEIKSAPKEIKGSEVSIVELRLAQLKKRTIYLIPFNSWFYNIWMAFMLIALIMSMVRYSIV